MRKANNALTNLPPMPAYTIILQIKLQIDKGKEKCGEWICV